MDEIKRESFVFYRSFINMVDNLPEDRQLEMYRTIFNYALDGEECKYEKGTMEYVIWCAVVPQIKANNIRMMNGLRGGAPAGNQNARKTKKQPKTTENNQEQPNVNVNENVNGNENGNENVNEYKKKKLIKEKRIIESYALAVWSEHRQLWRTWLAHLARIGHLYKTEEENNKAYDEWVAMFKPDMYKAEAIIQRSIDHDYWSLYDIKNYVSPAEKEGFIYMDEDGNHYESRTDLAKKQNSYEELLELRRKTNGH